VRSHILFRKEALTYLRRQPITPPREIYTKGNSLSDTVTAHTPVLKRGASKNPPRTAAVPKPRRGNLTQGGVPPPLRVAGAGSRDPRRASLVSLSLYAVVNPTPYKKATSPPHLCPAL